MSPNKRKYPVSKAAERRLAAGASLKQLSNKLAEAGFKVSPSTIWRWEVGQGTPPSHMWEVWTKALTIIENELRRKLQALVDERPTR